MEKHRVMLESKRQKTFHGSSDPFSRLPDDLIILILSSLISSATCPSDFVCILLTCKRLNQLGLDPLVLSRAGSKTLAVRAKNWSEDAHRFLKRCVFTGNNEACYALGMIRFYCLQYRRSGLVLMAKAAKEPHALALYSLAVIQFNGSGRSSSDKDLRAGVALSARAASLDHIDALREVGHCLQEGYGVRKNIAESERFFSKAEELESGYDTRAAGDSSFRHPVSRFLTEWFDQKEAISDRGLRLCSYTGCGRPETRPNEFRRCSACAKVSYCSRACQVLDWRSGHDGVCVNRLFDLFAGSDGEGDDDHPMAEIEDAINGKDVNDDDVDDLMASNGDDCEEHENDDIVAIEDAGGGIVAF